MVKFFFWCLTICLVQQSLGAQNLQNLDTLIIHPFQGLLDPTDTMMPIANGNDLQWVNYDEDNEKNSCFGMIDSIKNWFWEGDLGYNAGETENDAMTSCSWLQNINKRNRNWLILPPVYIPDQSYRLFWKSLSFYGPDYTDGYQVLVSKATNFTNSDNFKDTLFTAAETLGHSQTGSLHVSDYDYTPGYLHANSYTDTSYYYLDYTPDPPFLPYFRGRLEPHYASLAAYAGQTVYIAFLHDSKDDYQLQIDDILVTKTFVSTNHIGGGIQSFTFAPNPVKEGAYCQWKLDVPQAGKLTLLDNNGKSVWQKQFSEHSIQQMYLDIQHLNAGVYYCVLQTANGRAIEKLVKY